MNTPRQRRSPFFRAKVFDLRTGRFLLTCRVQAENLVHAERMAIAAACFSVRGNPSEMDVRHLHQLTSP